MDFLCSSWRACVPHNRPHIRSSRAIAATLLSLAALFGALECPAQSLQPLTPAYRDAPAPGSYIVAQPAATVSWNSSTTIVAVPTVSRTLQPLREPAMPAVSYRPAARVPTPPLPVAPATSYAPVLQSTSVTSRDGYIIVGDAGLWNSPGVVATPEPVARVSTQGRGAPILRPGESVPANVNYGSQPAYYSAPPLPWLAPGQDAPQPSARPAPAPFVEWAAPRPAYPAGDSRVRRGGRDAGDAGYIIIGPGNGAGYPVQPAEPAYPAHTQFAPVARARDELLFPRESGSTQPVGSQGLVRTSPQSWEVHAPAPRATVPVEARVAPIFAAPAPQPVQTRSVRNQRDAGDAGYIILGPGTGTGISPAPTPYFEPPPVPVPPARPRLAPPNSPRSSVSPDTDFAPRAEVYAAVPVPAPPQDWAASGATPAPRAAWSNRAARDAGDAGYIIIGAAAAPQFEMPAAPEYQVPQYPVPQVPANFEIPTGLTAQDRLALAPGMPLNERRNLLQLYSKLGNVGMAESLARHMLAEAPDDRATYLALAPLYLEQRDTAKALATAQRFASVYPNDREALYFLGAAQYQAGQYEEAQRSFTAMKQDVPAAPQGRPFKHQADLASAAYQAGDWRTARAAYTELVAAPETKEELRAEAQRLLTQLQHEHDPQLSVGLEGAFIDGGGVLRTKAAWRQPLDTRYSATARYSREDVHVAARPALRERDTDSNDGTVTLDTRHNRNWSTAASIGGWGGGVQGGASVTRHLDGRGEVKLEGWMNERSLDSLLMESLDGRQHRGTLSATYLFHPKWLGHIAVTGRETLVSDSQLGASVQGNWNLEHIVLNDSRYLGVGYRGLLFHHDRRTGNVSLVAPSISATATPADQQAVLANLIVSRLHRQGGYLTWSHQLTPGFAWFAGAGADYAFDQSHMAFNGLGGLTWKPHDRLELRTELDYFTSARTSDQSSDLWQFSLALRAWF